MLLCFCFYCVLSGFVWVGFGCCFILDALFVGLVGVGVVVALVVGVFD